jgi:predicted transcriptional regulator
VPENVDLRNIVAEIAAAYFRKNRVGPSQIQTVLDQIATSLSAVGAATVELPLAPPAQVNLSRARIRKSIMPDALISFEDNKPYKTLWRHLAARGLSPEEYRLKWGLPNDYPMAARSYRQRSASLAEAPGPEARLALSAEPAEFAFKTLPLESASNIVPVVPQSNTPAAEPVAKPVPAAPTTKQSPWSLELLQKGPSTPSAFRPRESGRDPEASARHQRWFAMLSETDWARIRAISRQVNHAHVPAVLTDLTAPLRVRACLAGHEARFPGEHVGTLRGGQVAILVSERGDH